VTHETKRKRAEKKTTSVKRSATKRRPLHAHTPSARSSTDLERRCAELERSLEAAAAAEAARADLLSIVSHDLRNPLGLIMVTSTLLARELEAEPGYKRQLDTIKRAAAEMNQIVEDFVDATRIEAGRLLLGQEVHDAAAILDDAVTAAALATANKPITLVKEVAPELPPLYVDRSRVLQVFSRLVQNAAHFMQKGGLITLRAEPTSRGARFSVSDTGPGIPTSERSLLFSRKPPAGRRSCQGTGLSVFVAKGIVEAHGGTNTVGRAPEGGAEFRFTLPVSAPAYLT